MANVQCVIDRGWDNESELWFDVPVVKKCRISIDRNTYPYNCLTTQSCSSEWNNKLYYQWFK